MLWNEFLNKLSDAKHAKLNKGLSVPAITTLIYSGAFDDSVQDLTPANRLDTYLKMYQEVREALDSDAKLPSRKKGDVLRIADITGDITLALWRSQSNPLTDFDLLNSDNVTKWLKFHHGFEKHHHEVVKWHIPSSEKYGKKPGHLIDKWSWVFENDYLYDAYSRRDSKIDLMVFGVVIDPEIKIYQGYKERLAFKIFTGREYTDEITMWPDSEDGKISDVTKQMIVTGAVGLAVVKPSKFAGKKTGTIQKFHRFVI